MATDKHALAYIGLGSNLDNPSTQIRFALDALANLPNSKDLKCSQWYQSKAIGPGQQPDYINTVACLRTTLAPLTLLKHLQAIENQQGRQRDIRWGARTLDLDLLLYDHVILNTPELQLPHPEMTNRSFVLLPLYTLTPELILPGGDTLKQLIAHCDTSDLTPMSDTQPYHLDLP